MRPTLAILIALSLVGCAAQHNKPQATNDQQLPQFEDRVSTALVFDPPIARDNPPLALARDVREPYSVLGYDETTTTSFSTYYNDTQYGPFNLPSLWFERQATSIRYGVSFR
jgi:hypothetical protein